MKVLKKKDYIPNDFIAASRKYVSYVTPPHLHEFYELEFIISGRGVCVVDNIEYNFSGGDVFLLTPLNVQEIKSADAELINVMFRIESIDESLFDLVIRSLKNPLIQLKKETADFVCQLLLELISVCEKDIKYSKLLLNCVIRKLLGERKVFEEPTTYVQRAILYLTENFGGDITLSATAKHVNISPVYLSKIFKKELNTTFSDYLDEMRFSYAQNLLASTELSILEICYLAGFKDYANFTRRFKKSFCITPSEYRRTKKFK